MDYSANSAQTRKHNPGEQTDIAFSKNCEEIEKNIEISKWNYSFNQIYSTYN